ncbi:MAG: hypothetical protein AAF721_07430 [Myxococcota bacterium]
MLTAVLLALSMAMAPADGTLANPDAQAAFDRATAAYQSGDYEAASEALAEAYALEPEPELLYARAQMARLQGDCATAIDLYRAYLATNAAKRADAEENLARCQALAAVQNSAQKDAGPPPEPEPAPEPEPEPEPGTPPPRPRPDVVALALGGTGLMALAVGSALVPIAVRQADNAGRLRVHDDYAAQYRSAVRSRNAGLAMLATGGALVIGAVIRYAVVRRRHRSQAR